MTIFYRFMKLNLSLNLIFQLHKQFLCLTCNSVRYSHKYNYIFYYLCPPYLFGKKKVYLSLLKNVNEYFCF